MAASNGRKTNVPKKKYYGNYVDGNTVRKIEPAYDAPARPKKRPQQQPRQKEIIVGYEKREAVLGLRYTLFLVTALALILGACIIYMNANIKLSRVKRDVFRQQEVLRELQEENAVLSEEVADVQINLEDVYQTATGTFGMVYAGQDQIIYYDSNNSDYIRQFGEIPE